MNRSERAALLLLSSAAILGCGRTPRSGPPQAKTPLVSVSHPVVAEVVEFENFTGRTDAVKTVQVVARVTGYIKPHLTRAGAEVSAGDPLFEIDARPYQAEVDRTEATVAQAEARLKRLDADYARAKLLMGRAALSRAEFDQTVGDHAEAKAAVEVARADRELAQLNLGFTRVTAPIGGRTSRGLIDPGGLVKADETILTSIVSLDPIYVYFDVDERTLLRLRQLVRDGKLKSHREATLPVRVALADEDGFPHEGTIDFSDNRVDPNTGTLSVRGVIPNPEPRAFTPGMFVRVRLPIGSPRRALLVPERALVTEHGQKDVYIVAGDGEVVRRPVVVGPLRGGLRVIEQGLAEDEEVIVSGLQRARPGAKVRVREVQPESSLAASAPRPTAGIGPSNGSTPVDARSQGGQ